MNKILDFKIFGVFTVRQFCIDSAAVSVLMLLAGAAIVYTAYKFGATCIDSEKYEGYFVSVWLISTFFIGMFWYGGIILFIQLGMMKKIKISRLSREYWVWRSNEAAG